MYDFKKLRWQAMKSQTEVANSVGITNATLSLIENGKAKPKIETVIKLCTYYGVDWHDYYND